ncbi:hypothetical protein HDU98_012016 [Podochytrium sp. JEL0797]|nr:hypothetical protein HDU98_012016 [Podochytrium sp. JEL0797]
MKDVETKFREAMNWLANTGQGIREDDWFTKEQQESQIASYIKKLCPFFDRVSEVMADRPSARPLATNKDSRIHFAPNSRGIDLSEFRDDNGDDNDLAVSDHSDDDECSQLSQHSIERRKHVARCNIENLDPNPIMPTVAAAECGGQSSRAPNTPIAERSAPRATAASGSGSNKKGSGSNGPKRPRTGAVVDAWKESQLQAGELVRKRLAMEGERFEFEKEKERKRAEVEERNAEFVRERLEAEVAEARLRAEGAKLKILRERLQLRKEMKDMGMLDDEINEFMRGENGIV